MDNDDKDRTPKPARKGNVRTANPGTMTGYKHQGATQRAFVERCKRLYFLQLCSTNFFPNSLVRAGYAKEVYKRGVDWYNKNSVPAASQAEGQQEDESMLTRMHIVTHCLTFTPIVPVLPDDDFISMVRTPQLKEDLYSLCLCQCNSWPTEMRGDLIRPLRKNGVKAIYKFSEVPEDSELSEEEYIKQRIHELLNNNNFARKDEDPANVCPSASDSSR